MANLFNSGWSPKTNPACSKCPLRYEGICVKSEGNQQAKLAVAGIHPDWQEEKKKRPFVGPSGFLFNRILQEAGIDRSELFITNAANCRPKEIQVAPDSQPNAWMGKKECEERIVKNCKTRFLQELQIVRPRVIVAFGGLPLEVLTGKRSITKRHGALHIIDIDRILAEHEGMETKNWVFREASMTYVIPLFHPAYILRGKPQFHPVHIQKFKRAKAIAEGEQPAVYREILVASHIRDVDYTLDLAEAHTDRWIAEKRPLAVDVEATMEGGSRHAAFTVFGYSSEHYRTGIAISILEWSERFQRYFFTWNREQWIRVRRLIEKIMLSQNSKCYHNFGYDVTLLRRFLDHLGGLLDTIVLHSLFQPDLPHGLDFVCQSELDIPAWKRDFRQSEKKGTANNLDLLHYNCQDHGYGGLIKVPLTNKVFRRGNAHLIEHTMQICELARRAHLNGVPLDMNVMEEVRSTQLAKREEALLELRKAILASSQDAEKELNAAVQAEAVDPSKHKWISIMPVTNEDGKVVNEKGKDNRGFNPRAARQSRWFLYDMLGLQPLYYTPGGVNKDPTKIKPSHATKAIVDYMSHPLVKKYIEYYEANADLNTLKPAVRDRYYDPVTGCTHPSWNPTSMKGTRWTSSYNCVRQDTEILTENGWVLIKDLDPAEKVKVAQWWENGTIEYVVPTDYISKQHTGHMIHIRTRHLDICVTDDHRLVGQYKKYVKKENKHVWKRKKLTAGDLVYGVPKHFSFYQTGLHYTGKVREPFERIALLAALQADGTRHVRNGTISWTVSLYKQRKVNRLTDILERLGTVVRWAKKALNDKGNVTNLGKRNLQGFLFTIFADSEIISWLEKYITIGKVFQHNILQWTKACLAYFCYESTQWDGRAALEEGYASVVKKNVELLQAAAVLSNSKGHGSLNPLRSPVSTKDCWYLNKGSPSGLSGISAKHVTVETVSNEPVYCVSVPSGYIVTRRNTKVAVIGNCQNWAKQMRKVFVAPPGRVWVGADLSQVEYRIASVFAGIPPLLDLFNAPAFDEFAEPWKKLDGQYDAHSMVAAEVFGNAFIKETDEKKKGGLRTLVKRVVYALFYGAMPRKIYETLRRDRRLSTGIRALLTLERIEEIHEGFRKRFPEWDNWADEEQASVRRSGVQIFPPFDRRRGWRLADMEGMLEPQKIRNCAVQLAAGDVVNRMFWKIEEGIYRRNLDARFSIHLHDAGYWNTAEKDAEAVKELVNENFTMHLEGYKGHRVHIYGQASIGATAADVG